MSSLLDEFNQTTRDTTTSVSTNKDFMTILREIRGITDDLITAAEDPHCIYGDVVIKYKDFISKYDAVNIDNAALVQAVKEAQTALSAVEEKASEVERSKILILQKAEEVNTNTNLVSSTRTAIDATEASINDTAKTISQDKTDIDSMRSDVEDARDTTLQAKIDTDVVKNIVIATKETTLTTATTVDRDKNIIADLKTDTISAKELAEQYKNDSMISRDFANKEEDVEVLPGEYSAYHWSKKAESATNLSSSDIPVEDVYTEDGTIVVTNNVQVSFENLVQVVNSTNAIVNTNTTKVDEHSDKLNTIENGATADQTKEDIDDLGINANTVGGKTVETSVPANAVFTDTVYDDSDVVKDTDFTGAGFMKTAANGTYSVDSNTYLTEHQDISGKANINHSHNLADLGERSYNNLTDKPDLSIYAKTNGDASKTFKVDDAVENDEAVNLSQFGKVYYVDSTDGDDNNDGSSTHPFKTFKKAVYASPRGSTSSIKLFTDRVYDIADSINLDGRSFYISMFGNGDNPVLQGYKDKFVYANTVNSIISVYKVDINTANDTALSANNTVFRVRGCDFTLLMESSDVKLDGGLFIYGYDSFSKIKLGLSRCTIDKTKTGSNDFVYTRSSVELDYYSTTLAGEASEWKDVLFGVDADLTNYRSNRSLT